MAKRKFILVLGGGGAKAAFQIGAIDYLYQHGFYHNNEHIPGSQVKFDYIAGISAGSLNASLVAMNEFSELKRVWEEDIAGNPEAIWTSEYVDANLQQRPGLLDKFLPKIGLGKGLGLIFSKKKKDQLAKEIFDNILKIQAIASNKPLQDRLDDLIDISKIKDTLLRVGYVSLDTGLYHSVHNKSFDSNEEFKKAVIASTSMPLVWNPVVSVQSKDDYGNEILHCNLIDGGIRNVSPLGDVIKDINKNYRPDTEYFVFVINNHKETLPLKSSANQNFISIAYRALVDITLNEILINDVQEFKRINDLLHQVEAAKQRGDIPAHFQLRNPKNNQPYRKFHCKIIQPQSPMGTTLDFGRSQIHTRIKHGFDVAENLFGQQA